MSAAQLLAGKRIAVLAADGFEQAELEAAVAALKEAGAQLDVVALRPGRIRGMHVHQSADLLRVDTTVQAARAADYDGLVVPGGYISPDLLRQSAPARAFVRQLHDAGKPVALMSQAPLLLISAGLAARRALTSWPGVRDDVVNAGATWLNQDVVRDANCLTSRSPQDAQAFVRALAPFLAGTADSDPAPRREGSDPAREEPSEPPGQPLRWLSAPSVGAMLSLALLGVGVVAANRGLKKRQSRDEAVDAATDPPKPGPS